MKVQSENIYRFNVGTFECTIFLDASAPMDLHQFYSDIPAEERERAIEKYELYDNVLEVMCLLIKTGSENVVIDTGIGPDMPFMGEGRFARLLESEGIDNHEITHVLSTHAHPDHVGGHVDSQGNSQFPNAQIYYSKTEHDFWTGDSDLTKYDEPIREELLKCVKKNMTDVQNQVKLIEMETEFVPGIRTIGIPGHTPGQIGAIVSSNDETLFVVSDLFHHKIEILEPHWYISFDHFPEQAIDTRAKIYPQIVEEKPLVFACHLPFPGLGYIIRKGDQDDWQPIETS